MVSRRKILSRSRDDLNLDQTFTQQEEEEDVWYQKDKLYKVSDHNLLKRMQFITIMRVRWQLAISWKRLPNRPIEPPIEETPSKKRSQVKTYTTRQMEAKWHDHDQNCRHRQRSRQLWLPLRSLLLISSMICGHFPWLRHILDACSTAALRSASAYETH